MNLISKENIQSLKESKEVLCIYRLPCSLYNSGFEYIIIANILDNIEDFDNVRYFNSGQWFDRMQSGSLLPIVCATLSKTGKIKEYVNVYIKPDIIKLRKYILNRFTELQETFDNLKFNLENEISQECLWGIQVIKESKVNRVDVFKEKIQNPLKDFIIAVEPIYKMWKEKNE